MKRILIILAVVLGLVAGGGWGARAWRRHVIEKQEQDAFKLAGDLIQASKPAEALGQMRDHARPDSKYDWSAIELQAATGLGDLNRLRQIWEQKPARILAREDSSLLVARYFLHGRKPGEVQKIRQAWKGHEPHPEFWTMFDADALLVAGKVKEAEAFLRAHPLAGKGDTARLCRLSSLVAKHDLKEAWQLLGQAVALDPRNTDVRLFRAQMMENAGRAEAARFEYVSAVLSRTNDFQVRDELAEFYRRQGSYDLALETWGDRLTNGAPDYYWLKSAFWSRMVQPQTLPTAALPAGGWQPLTQWILDQPAGKYFDTNSFAKLPEHFRYAADRQEVFWLQLTDLLQRGYETNALQLLKYNTFHTRSWNPALESVLLQILSYRLKGSLTPEKTDFTATTGNTNQHQFFLDVGQAARLQLAGRKDFITPELSGVLRGPQAFAMAYLAAGWREAALTLFGGATNQTVGPGWLAYDFAQVVRGNRGPAAARAFLAKQKPTPELQLLTGEILLQERQGQAALDQFKPLAPLATSVGFRASYILALAEFDRGQFAAAAQWIQAQPLLARSTIGQELLGRLAFRQGREAEADRIYTAIAATSVEAKAHLARRAFAKKDWPLARKYTNELLAEMPDELELRKNLLAIDQAEAGKK